MLSSSSSTIYGANNQPMFHVKTSKHSKPNVVITRTNPSGHPELQPFATGAFSSLSGSINMTIQNQIELKISYDMNSMSGARKFVHPQYGNLKWGYDSMGSAQELKDAQGQVLAKVRNDGLSSPKLEILVNGGDAFVEMVVVTGVTCLKAEEKEVKDVLKVLGKVI
jgi:hypothetical protein